MLQLFSLASILYRYEFAIAEWMSILIEIFDINYRQKKINPVFLGHMAVLHQGKRFLHASVLDNVREQIPSTLNHEGNKIHQFYI